jgi:hypothetical protein
LDKLLEIVLAAVVISVTGMALLFVVNGQTGSFTDFMGNQSSTAQCDLQKTQWEDAVCGSGDPGEIKSNAPDSCATGDWNQQSVSC